MPRRGGWILIMVGASLAIALAWLALRPTEPEPANPPVSTIVEQRVLDLVAGASASAQIQGGQIHLWPLPLKTDQFLDLVVDQQGVDVVVALDGPDGQRLTEIDSPNGKEGPEPLLVLSETPGTYRVEIRVSERASPGGYTIRVQALRTATPQDLLRVRAERRFAAGEGLRRSGDHDSLRRALATYRQAFEDFSALEDRNREATTLYRRGRVHSTLGEHHEARQLYLEALPRLRAQGRHQEVINALNSLGRSCRALGDPSQALATYREALELNRTLGHRSGELVTHNNLGKLYDTLGEVGHALSHLEQAATGYRELGNSRREAGVLSNLGWLYLSQGETQHAQDAFKQALTLLDSANDRRPRAGAYAGLGIVHGRKDERTDALDSLDRALALYRQVGDRLEEAVVLHNIGWLHKGAGRSREAYLAFSEALTIFRELGDRRSQAAALTQLGAIDANAQRHHEALTRLHSALKLYEAIGDRKGESAALLGLARAQRLQGELIAASETSERALGKVESQRRRSAGPAMRATYFSSQQDHYDFHIDLLMELHQRQPPAGWLGKAFEATERRRARGLLDALVEAGADLRRGVSPEILSRAADLERQLGSLEGRRWAMLDEHHAPASVEMKLLEQALADLESELRHLQRRYDRVQAEIRQASPAYKGLTEPQPLTLEQVQTEILDPDTLLLVYSLGQERSFLFAVTATEAESFPLPARQAIEEDARRVHQRLTTSYRRTARATTKVALDDLGDILLAPATRLRRGKQRLLVIVDGALHYLPFAALTVPLEGPKTADPASHPPGPRHPLVTEHEVVRLPSISVLEQLRRERPPAPGALAILFDPVYEADDPRLARPTVAPGPTTFPRLPFSSQEAAAILELAMDGEVLTASGFDARRELVTDGELSRYRILHFAVHGVLEAKPPETSGIVLSMFDPEGRSNPGFLPAREVYGLDMPADLVVLSACQTALGKEVRGEGLVGLTQAFFHAGASQLLVSLWQVDDRATAELMQRFYRAMFDERLPAAAALRAAQVSMSREKRWTAPYFWAGFVLQGASL